MRLDTSQQMRLSQRMTMAPRMIQAMEILQLPLLALLERIDTELSSNPVLEVRDTTEEPAETPEPVEADAQVEPEQPLVVKDNDDQAEDFQRLEAYEQEYEPEGWEGENYRPARSSDSGERDKKLDAMANTPAPGISLYEYLMNQWAFVEAPPDIRQAGELIIQRIDDDGYLREGLDDLPAQTNKPVTLEHLRAALPLVQRLDPTGVGARDLRECLLIQLAAKQAAGQDVRLQIALVRHFLRDIEMNRLPQIAKRTGKSTAEQVRDAIATARPAQSAAGPAHRRTDRPGRRAGRSSWNSTTTASRHPHGRRVAALATDQPRLPPHGPRTAVWTTRPRSSSSGTSARPSGSSAPSSSGGTPSAAWRRRSSRSRRPSSSTGRPP